MFVPSSAYDGELERASVVHRDTAREVLENGWGLGNVDVHWTGGCLGEGVLHMADVPAVVHSWIRLGDGK